MTPFAVYEKLAAIKREVSYRERLYPRLVAEGKMKQANADRGIEIMQAIEADYAELVEAEVAKMRLL